MKLLFFGEKHHDEFLTDYIKRIAARNGFARVKCFERYLKEICYREWKDSSDVDEYMALKMGMEKVLERNIQEDCSSLAYGWSGFSQYHRLCEKCLKENGYIRFYWRLNGYKKCHVHGNFLSHGNRKSIVIDDRVESFRNLEGDRSIYKIICFFSIDEIFQKNVMLELRREAFDRFLIYSLKHLLGSVYRKLRRGEYIRKCEFDFDELNLMLNEGALVGMPVADRLRLIVESLDKSKSYWDSLMRIIALMICNPKKKGIHLSSYAKGEHQNYLRFALYYLGVDKLLGCVLEKSRDLKFDEIEKIPIHQCIHKRLADDQSIKKEIQLAAYFCSSIDSWGCELDGEFRARGKRVRYLPSLDAKKAEA
ncbi:MAG: hypothetical protein HPY82_16925 [Gammaproteobacteria bacterium]|nr:hypothetical protein [Gammaproteobacteria bacterium]